MNGYILRIGINTKNDDNSLGHFSPFKYSCSEDYWHVC